MAYSGAVQVIQFQAISELVSAATAMYDPTNDSGDLGILIVPTPLMVYAFGAFIHEDLGATLIDVLLQRSLTIAGTDTTVATLDLSSTNLTSGDGNSPLVTASTGSGDIDNGDVVYAAASSFPVLITAPQVLTVSASATEAIAGEYTMFIVARWQGMDLRPTSVWADAS